MDSLPTAVIIIVVIAIYLNVIATFHVLNVDTLSPIQRIFQFILAWIIPVFGAIFITSFHLSDREYVNQQKSKKGLSPRLINLLTFTFLVGAGGGLIRDYGPDSGEDSGGYDGGGGSDGD